MNIVIDLPPKPPQLDLEPYYSLVIFHPIFFFRIRNRFYEMCNPSLLIVLKENVQSLGEKWSELSYLVAEKATNLAEKLNSTTDKQKSADLNKVDEADLAETIDSLAFNPFQVSFKFNVGITVTI